MLRMILFSRELHALLVVQVKEMQSMMEPLLKQVIEVVTMETVEDWGNCMTDISVSILKLLYCVPIIIVFYLCLLVLGIKLP